MTESANTAPSPRKSDNIVAPPPSVSVIAAVHNGAAFLEASIRSILDQSFTDFEFLIVDDGSTDDSPALLDRFATEDTRIRVFHRENAGLTVSLGIALKEARGVYIARQDDDDISLPDRLRRQKEFLDAHPSVAVIGCRYKTIDPSGKIVGHSNVPMGNASIKRALLTHNVIAHSGAMFHRQKVLDIGGYDPQYRTAQDYDLWCRAALHHDLGNLKDVLLHRRRHGAQIGATLSASQIQNRDRIKRAYRRAAAENRATCPLPLPVRLLAKMFVMLDLSSES